METLKPIDSVIAPKNYKGTWHATVNEEKLSDYLNKRWWQFWK